MVRKKKVGGSSTQSVGAAAGRWKEEQQALCTVCMPRKNPAHGQKRANKKLPKKCGQTHTHTHTVFGPSEYGGKKLLQNQFVRPSRLGKEDLLFVNKEMQYKASREKGGPNRVAGGGAAPPDAHWENRREKGGGSFIYVDGHSTSLLEWSNNNPKRKIKHLMDEKKWNSI